MESMTVMPRQSYDWTVDDLDRLPVDGLQYELLEGVLLVTPAPVPNHQRLVGAMYRLLYAACPQDRFEVFLAPLDWRPDARTSLQPDLLVVGRDEVGPKNITAPLALAVEVLSPSTRRKDQVLKRSKYEDAGVQAYWIIDPEGPSVTAWTLRDGRYVDAGTATGDDELDLTEPFGVRAQPSALIR